MTFLLRALLTRPDVPAQAWARQVVVRSLPLGELALRGQDLLERPYRPWGGSWPTVWQTDRAVARLLLRREDPRVDLDPALAVRRTASRAAEVLAHHPRRRRLELLCGSQALRALLLGGFNEAWDGSRPVQLVPLLKWGHPARDPGFAATGTDLVRFTLADRTEVGRLHLPAKATSAAMGDRELRTYHELRDGGLDIAAASELALALPAGPR